MALKKDSSNSIFSAIALILAQSARSFAESLRTSALIRASDAAVVIFTFADLYSSIVPALSALRTVESLVCAAETSAARTAAAASAAAFAAAAQASFFGAALCEVARLPQSA